MSARLDRVEQRARLKPRRDAYWQRLTQGRYIGFRRMTAGTPGTWLARYYDGEKYHYSPLGDFATLDEKERYDAAKKAAEEWFKHLDMGGSTEATSVKEACEAYVANRRTEESDANANDAAGRFKRLVYNDPIAKLLLSKLTKHHCSAWRARVLERSETKSSFNRNVMPLRAALNLAHERDHIASDHAWRMALKPFPGKDVHNPRTLYLDGAKRRKLVEKASAEARPFFATLNMLPLRPGEVAALRVEHLQQRTLEIPTGKTEARVIPLTNEALAHFKSCARDKLPSAWLVSRADSSQWKKKAWCDEIKAAVKKAKLPAATVAYTLRHSVITDLVTGGLDVFTVAKLAGTSVLMIDKTYGKLRSEHARSALEKLALM